MVYAEYIIFAYTEHSQGQGESSPQKGQLGVWPGPQEQNHHMFSSFWAI